MTMQSNCRVSSIKNPGVYIFCRAAYLVFTRDWHLFKEPLVNCEYGNKYTLAVAVLNDGEIVGGEGDMKEVEK